MLRGAVLLCVLAASVVAQEAFFEAYGRQKIMTNCFGEKLYYAQLTLFEGAKLHCHHQPTYIPGLQSATHTFNIISPTLVPTQVGYAYPAPPVFPATLLPPQGYQSPVLGKSRQARQLKDELFLSREALLGLIETVHAGLSNFTCVLRTLDVIDDNLNIRLDNIQRQYYQAPIEPALRQDMLDGVNLCYQTTGCLPVDQTKVPLPPQLQRLLFFSKCEKQQRFYNCLKHDIRRNLFRFDLSAFPDGGRVGKLEKLVAIIVGSGSLEELDEF